MIYVRLNKLQDKQLISGWLKLLKTLNSSEIQIANIIRFLLFQNLEQY